MENRAPYLWKQAKARTGFKMHLRSYLIVNASLWLIWLVISFATSGNGWNGFRYPWPIWATFGWGIGLASHYLAVYTRNDERSMVEREYEKLKMKNN